MRVLPRIRVPRFRSRRDKLRRRLGALSVASLTVALEALVYVSLLVFIFTGRRAAFLNEVGHHADVYVSLLLLAGFGLLHRFARRRLVPRIEEYFFPKPYQERRIFSGLGQEARAATSIDQLYLAIVHRIAESLESDDVSILVRDEASGDYVCVASSSQSAVSATIGRTESDLPDTQSALKLTRDAFIVRRLDRLSSPLVIESAELETWKRALDSAPAHLRPARTAEHETLRLLKSHIFVQIKSKDQMVGILSLGLRRGHFSYSSADRETLMSVAAQLALIVENSRLAERMVIQERLNRELLLAAEVQKRLLPERPPDHGSFELAGFCEPARGVGGDYYDFIAVDENRVGIAIADVAGKGMPAALLMSTVQATLRSLTAPGNGSSPSVEPSLAQMVGKLNRLIFNSTSGQHYVTFFYANFEYSSRSLTYVNAGHNPPFYLQSDLTKDFQQLTAGGLVAGAFEHCKYAQETLQMHRNDLLFLYTDGLSEAMNWAGEEFGEARIKEMLAACARLSVNEIRDQIVRRVKEWCTGAPLYDDLTFVVMKVN